MNDYSISERELATYEQFNLTDEETGFVVLRVLVVPGTPVEDVLHRLEGIRNHIEWEGLGSGVELPEVFQEYFEKEGVT